MALKFFGQFLFAMAIGLFFFQNSAQAGLSFEVLAPYTYSKLSPKQQKQYVDQIRKNWVEFEKQLPAQTVSQTPFWENLFFDSAYADSKKCIIGGRILNTIQVGKKNLCSTQGASCPNKPNKFHCGKIFSSVCVDKNPISGLSERCYQESSAKPLSEDEYQKMVTNLDQNFKELCNEKNMTNKDGCRTLADKMNDISKDHNVKFTSLDEYNKNPIVLGTTNSSDPKNSNQYGVLIPGCPNSVTTMGPMWVPEFGFKDDRKCTFESNEKILGELLKNGCDKTKDSQNLFITTFEPVPTSILWNENSAPDRIIESVPVGDKVGNSTIYTVHMLKANQSTIPSKIERQTVEIKEENNRYFVIDPLTKQNTEVKISNGYRPNILIRSQGVQSYYRLPNYLSGKAALADDCTVAEQLKTIIPTLPYTTPSTSEGIK